MAIRYKELKALVVPENFLENHKIVLKDSCMTVQRFAYDCEHKRNEAGAVYGPTRPVILEFAIRVNSPLHAKPFFQALNANEHRCYSILFNALFDTNQRLSEYEDGMVVDGYVVGVKEEFASSPEADETDRQIQLSVTLLVRGVTYLGSSTNYECKFIK